MDTDTLRRSHLDLERQTLDRFLGTAPTFAEAWNGCTEPGLLLLVLIEALRLSSALRSPLMGPIDVLWIFSALLEEMVEPLLVCGGQETVDLGRRISRAYTDFLLADASGLPPQTKEIEQLFAQEALLPTDPRAELVRRVYAVLDRVRCLGGQRGYSRLRRSEFAILLETLRDAALAFDRLCHDAGDASSSPEALRACYVIRWAPDGSIPVGQVVEQVLACGPHVRGSYQVTIVCPPDDSSLGWWIDICERASGALLGRYQIGARAPSLQAARDYSVSLLAIRSSRSARRSLPPMVTIRADVPITARFSAELDRSAARAA